MISYYKRGRSDHRLRELKAFEKDCWIRVVNPSSDELVFLAEKFDLNSENLTEGLDPHELPRVDVHDKTYIYADMPIGDGIQTLLIVIGDSFLLTLCKDESDVLYPLLENKKHVVTANRTNLLISILWLISDAMERTSVRLAKNVKTTRMTASSLSEKDVEDLLVQEEVLNIYVGAYYYTTLMFERLGARVRFSSKEKTDLQELLVEARQGYNVCRSALKSISNIRHYHSVLLSNKLNRTITILTLFTIFISIPAAVSGLYGMNVSLPFQDHKAAFYFVLLLVFGLWGSFVVFMKKKNLL